MALKWQYFLTNFSVTTQVSSRKFLKQLNKTLIQVIEVQLQAIQAEGDQRCYSQIIVGPEKDNYTLTVGGCDPERSTIYDAFSSFNG